MGERRTSRCSSRPTPMLRPAGVDKCPHPPPPEARQGKAWGSTPGQGQVWAGAGEWGENPQGKGLHARQPQQHRCRDPPGGESGPALATEWCSAASWLFMLRKPSAKRVSCPFSTCCSWRMAVRSCCLLRQFWGEKGSAPPPLWLLSAPGSHPGPWAPDGPAASPGTPTPGAVRSPDRDSPEPTDHGASSPPNNKKAPAFQSQGQNPRF